jgi:predicted dehydrogenase
MMKTILLLLIVAVLPGIAGEIQLGLIGLDTSHVIEFTRRFNDPSDPNHVPGGKVVAAYKTFSPDIPDSAAKVEGYAKELQDKYKVVLSPTIPDLCLRCDAVLITSVDGRPHLDQARQVIAARKAFFVDKPGDAVTLFREADQAGVPVFSASSLRWYPGVVEVATADLGSIRAAFSSGPSATEPHHPTLFWYGIHPTEALFTVLGSDCRNVRAVRTDQAMVAVGLWKNGALGTLQANLQGPWSYKVIKTGEKGVAEQKTGGDYTPMLREMMAFFQTGRPPVSPKETLAIHAFMEAVDESLRQGGRGIELRDVLIAADCPEKWIP